MKLGAGSDQDGQAGRVDTWVPPGPGVASDGGLDLAAQIPRLRVLAWRAAAIAMLWVAVLAGGIVGLDQLSQAAQRLLETGITVTGTVRAESTPNKGSWTIDVQYPAGGTSRTAKIVLDSNRRYTPGQPVIVNYDPGDPGHVRTPQDKNINQALLALSIVGIVLAAVGIPVSLRAAAGWLRRYRAVVRTGWHAASVRVTRMTRTRPFIAVTYSGGGDIALQAVSSTHVTPHAARSRPRQAWVGGQARAMVVLFPREGRKYPYTVPARAQSPRRISPARKAAAPARRNHRKYAASLLIPAAVIAMVVARRRF
jgi:hypothetical protein